MAAGVTGRLWSVEELVDRTSLGEGASITNSRLILLVLEVESLDASIRFYRDLLGISLVPDIDHGGDDR